MLQDDTICFGYDYIRQSILISLSSSKATKIGKLIQNQAKMLVKCRRTEFLQFDGANWKKNIEQTVQRPHLRQIVQRPHLRENSRSMEFAETKEVSRRSPRELKFVCYTSRLEDLTKSFK